MMVNMSVVPRPMNSNYGEIGGAWVVGENAFDIPTKLPENNEP